MKKLIAMIGAVAMSFGLFAAMEDAGPFATSFEAAEGVTEATYTPGDGWTWEGDPLTVGVYAGDKYTYGDGALARRNGSFQDNANNNYLKLETGANTLTRDVNGNVFLDQLVKFTGFEEYQTNVVAGTKIAVWMSGIEGEGTPAVPAVGEPEIDNGEGVMIPNPDYVPAVSASDDYIAGETNLYVTVGKIDGDGKVTPVAIKIAGNYKLDTWYRLTIKSLDSIFQFSDHAGFIIYVDGQQVNGDDDAAKALIVNADDLTALAAGYMAKGQLFPAIDKENATFATVGYQGIGAVDDIIIDTEGPEFARSVEVTAADLAIAGAKIVKVEQAGVVVAGTGSWLVKPGDIVVYYAPDGAFVITGDGTATWTVSAQGAEKKLGMVEDEDIVPADVQVVSTGYVTNYYTQAMFEAKAFGTPATFVDGDVITVLNPDGLSSEDEVLGMHYSFTPGATIAIEDVTQGAAVVACKWIVSVPDYETVRGTAAGEVVFNLGVEPAKQIEVTFTGDNAEDGSIAFSGTIAGEGAYLKVNNGTLKASDVMLVGDAKVITATAIEGYEDIFLNEETIEEKEVDDFFEYSIKGAAPTTGFAIIIADAQAGTATTNYYATLQEAINAAGTEGLPSVVTVLEDATLTACAEIAKDITIDLGGKTLTTSATCGNAATAFNITAGNVIIKNGTIDGTQVADAATVDVEVDTILVRGGTLTLNDAALTVKVASKNGACVYAFNAGKVNISAGTFMNLSAENYQYKPDWKGMALNQANVADQLITVTGGSFKQVNPTLGDDAALCKSYLAEGYEATFDPDTGFYSVEQSVAAVAKIGTTTYPTLAAAFAAVADGQTIQLLGDYTAVEGEVLTFADSATLDLGGYTLTVPSVVRTADKFIVPAGKEVTLTNGKILFPADNGGGRSIKVNGTVNVECEIENIGTDEAGAVFDVCNGAVVNVGDNANLTSKGTVFWSKKAGSRTINITGGTCTTTSDTGCYTIFYASYAGCEDTINITGGKLVTGGNDIMISASDAVGDWTINCSLDDSCKAKFSNLNGEIADYIADGYAPVLGQDGFYTIQKAYAITIAPVENGTLETSVTNNIAAGTEVTITATPAANYELVSITTNGTAITGTTFVMPAENVTVAATFKSAGPFYPPTWPDAETYTEAFGVWAGKYDLTGVDLTTDAAKNAFLWNADPKGELPALKIESIAVAEGVATIVVSAEGKNLKTGINGVLYVSGCNALGGEWVTTVVDATADSFTTDGKATFTVEGAQFMKAKIGFKAETPAVK